MSDFFDLSKPSVVATLKATQQVRVTYDLHWPSADERRNPLPAGVDPLDHWMCDAFFRCDSFEAALNKARQLIADGRAINGAIELYRAVGDEAQARWRIWEDRVEEHVIDGA